MDNLEVIPISLNVKMFSISFWIFETVQSGRRASLDLIAFNSFVTFIMMIYKCWEKKKQNNFKSDQLCAQAVPIAVGSEMHRKALALIDHVEKKKRTAVCAHN